MHGPINIKYTLLFGFAGTNELLCSRNVKLMMISLLIIIIIIIIITTFVQCIYNYMPETNYVHTPRYTVLQLCYSHNLCYM